MNKTFLLLGTILAGLAVILGAFGAHALKERITPEQVQVFDTGVRYQMYHSLALIFVFLLSQRMDSSLINYAGVFFICGIILFSGSVYLLACKELFGIESWKNIIGPVTPLGGLCFIIGWGCLVVAALRYNVK